MRTANSSRRSSPRSATIKASVPFTGSPRPSVPMTSPTYSRGIARCVRPSCRYTTGCRATPSHWDPRAVGRIRRTARFHLTRCAPWRRDSTIWEQWRTPMRPFTRWATNFAAEHPDMLLYEDDGQAIRFLDQIVLANPGNQEWQQHFAESYGSAMDAIGFDGLHVDTYGYPRVSNDANGQPVDIRAAYESFLVHLRAQRPSDLISFNQVNGVPSAARLPDGPTFRYCEVWPPNDSWRHFEGLLDRSSGRAGLVGDGRDARPAAPRFDRLLPTCVGHRYSRRSDQWRRTRERPAHRCLYRSDRDLPRR